MISNPCGFNYMWFETTRGVSLEKISYTSQDKNLPKTIKNSKNSCQCIS